jgi:putative transposase
MARLPRLQAADAMYHVTANAARKLMLFTDRDDRELFLRILGIATSKAEWLCHAYCLMGTHYHLVVETTIERLSAGMQYLNGEYAQTFNRRHGRDGHVFAERFAAWVIRDDDHYERTLAYVLTNPVRAGLVDDWTEWPWSRARGVNGRPHERTFAS